MSLAMMLRWRLQPDVMSFGFTWPQALRLAPRTVPSDLNWDEALSWLRVTKLRRQATESRQKHNTPHTIYIVYSLTIFFIYIVYRI